MEFFFKCVGSLKLQDLYIFAESKTQNVFTKSETPGPTYGMYKDINAPMFELIKLIK